MLSETQFYDALREGLWVSMLISAPILGVALIAGTAIGLFQALTSVQEMTLTFVPKLLALVAVFWVAMSFMSATLVSFFHDQVLPIIAGG